MTEQTHLEYVRYRIQRDLAGARAWFVDGWRNSWLFKLGAALMVLLLIIWAATWFWLVRDLPDAESLVDYETPLPSVVRGIDGEIVHSYARERRVQLQYGDFPQQLVEAYLSAEDKTFFSHGMPPKLLFCEMDAAGFRLIEFLEKPDIKGYFARFERLDERPDPNSITACTLKQVSQSN